jgi:hypothetical protein
MEPAEIPAKTYVFSADDTKDYPKYEKLWNEIFQILNAKTRTGRDCSSVHYPAETREKLVVSITELFWITAPRAVSRSLK